MIGTGVVIEGVMKNMVVMWSGNIVGNKSAAADKIVDLLLGNMQLAELIYLIKQHKVRPIVLGGKWHLFGRGEKGDK